MSAAIDVQSGFGVNSLFWFSAIRPGEEGLTRRITEDLAILFNSIGLPFQTYDVPTVAHLEDALNSIATAAQSESVKPVIHFDMHGSKEHGLEIPAEKKCASWEAVTSGLQKINIATGNNLCVVSSACYGLHAITAMTIGQPCPMFILIAPEHEVKFGYLEDRTLPFYRDVFSTCDVTAAYDKHLADKMKYFHCGKFLAISICKYIKANCRGKGLQERREKLLTEVFLDGRPKTPEALKDIRTKLKNGLKPDQEMLDRYVNTFMIGKPSGYTMDQLIALVDSAETANPKAKGSAKKVREAK